MNRTTRRILATLTLAGIGVGVPGTAFADQFEDDLFSGDPVTYREMAEYSAGWADEHAARTFVDAVQAGDDAVGAAERVAADPKGEALAQKDEVVESYHWLYRETIDLYRRALADAGMAYRTAIEAQAEGREWAGRQVAYAKADALAAKDDAVDRVGEAREDADERKDAARQEAGDRRNDAMAAKDERYDAALATWHGLWDRVLFEKDAALKGAGEAREDAMDEKDRTVDEARDHHEDARDEATDAREQATDDAIALKDEVWDDAVDLKDDAIDEGARERRYVVEKKDDVWDDAIDAKEDRYDDAIDAKDDGYHDAIDEWHDVRDTVFRLI